MSNTARSRKYVRIEAHSESDTVLEIERLFKDFRIGMLRYDNKGLTPYGYDMRYEELEQRVLAYLQGNH